MRNRIQGKIIPYPGRRRDGLTKPKVDEPERFETGELHRGRREDHTQKRFVPAAMEVTRETGSCKPPQSKKQKSQISGRNRSPSTLLLNRSNVKRKSAARGRTRL